MNESPEDIQQRKLAEKEAAKIRRGKRQGVRVILMIFPMIIGFAGLYLISKWSLQMRLYSPGNDVGSYYIGLMLLLLALQLPVFLEVNRRRTKKLSLRTVIAAMLALILALIALAATIAPRIDAETLAEMERTEWELMHGIPLHDEAQDALEDAIEDAVEAISPDSEE